MAAEDDSDDKTRVGAAPPPQPKLPPNRPAEPKAADDESDHTRIASAPPPRPKLPTPPPPSPATPAPEAESDHTQIAGAAPRPPVTPKVPSAPPPVTAAPAPTAPAVAKPVAPPPEAPPQAAPPATPRATAPSPSEPPVTRMQAVVNDATAGDDQTGDATVLITERVHVIMRLQRLQPAGRSEVIRLDRASYVLGRAHTCDIALFSPSASREHARLTNREGEWYIEPLPNKSVLVNGSEVSAPTLVTHKMHIQLGADELLFLDDRAAAQASAAPASHRRSTPIVGIIAAAVVALIAAALWWFLHK